MTRRRRAAVRWTRPDELCTELRELITRDSEVVGNGASLVEHTPRHWALRYDGRLLANVWPTALKMRATAENSQTLVFDTPAALHERLVSDVLRTALMEQERERAAASPTLPESLLADGPGQLLADAAAAEKPASYAPPPMRRRLSRPSQHRRHAVTPQQSPQTSHRKVYAAVDLSRDGNELRVIINGSQFSQSVRLSVADTQEFLQKAATLQREIAEVPVRG